MCMLSGFMSLATYVHTYILYIYTETHTYTPID